MFIRTLISATIVAASVTCASAGDISGAGATFPFPIYAKWADAYKTETGNGLNYQSIGSGAGIKQIKAKTVTFGATDVPLEPKDLDAAGLEQWPMVMGGIVLVVNLDGIKSGDLVIDGPTLAKIYLGKITNWNDPAIKVLNAKVALPDLAIAVIHRADGSGTTFNFTNYLDKVSPDWQSKVGESTSVEWPVGIGAKGNDGVANNVARHQGRDRLCRIRLRQAEQDDLRRHGQQGRQDGRAERRSLPGRRRQRRLGQGRPAIYLILIEPAGRGYLADRPPRPSS